MRRATVAESRIGALLVVAEPQDIAAYARRHALVRLKVTCGASDCAKTESSSHRGDGRREKEHEQTLSKQALCAYMPGKAKLMATHLADKVRTRS